MSFEIQNSNPIKIFMLPVSTNYYTKMTEHINSTFFLYSFSWSRSYFIWLSFQLRSLNIESDSIVVTQIPNWIYWIIVFHIKTDTNRLNILMKCLIGWNPSFIIYQPSNVYWPQNISYVFIKGPSYQLKNETNM